MSAVRTVMASLEALGMAVRVAVAAGLSDGEIELLLAALLKRARAPSACAFASTDKARPR